MVDPGLVPAPVEDAALLRVEGLRVEFPLRGRARRGPRIVRAVDDVSFELARGETLGLVGETGSGKSSLARAIMRRVPLARGRIFLDGTDITRTSGRELRRRRRDFQMVFQDPYTSLNPKMTVGEIVAEPLWVHGLVQSRAAAERRVGELLEMVAMPSGVTDRRPQELSGGQRQRIGIARALAVDPKLVVADEAVSALDVSIQAQVLKLMFEIQERLGVSYLFITHDLAVVRSLSHRVAVMYAGQIVEVGPADEICGAPKHPYTRALLSAVPSPQPNGAAARGRIVLRGDPPSPLDPPSGCRFHPRCPIAREECSTAAPPLSVQSSQHLAACWYAQESDVTPTTPSP